MPFLRHYVITSLRCRLSFCRAAIFALCAISLRHYVEALHAAARGSKDVACARVQDAVGSLLLRRPSGSRAQRGVRWYGARVFRQPTPFRHHTCSAVAMRVRHTADNV